ncbi:hypothetical protein LUZ61_013902 [Rhynchospora tenuis]|uniref:Myb-like domain-containing protein n=1 Tax=Rhynchospora tenuis TaxID=198213 RepID=A0AAD5WD36_9POAL|nr:hypothetical protein LUZ61_013902 [Rhynchospora tenuis]
MPGDPRQNGVAERRNRTLMDMVRKVPLLPQDQPLRKSQRERKSAIPDDYVVYLTEEGGDIGHGDDPISFKDAMKSDKSSQWLKAMNDEMNSMQQNDVWDLVELPKDVKPVGCKWVYKTKTDSHGNIERYKVRLVAKGFTQQEASSDLDMLYETKRFLSEKFEMKDLGEASYVIGIEIHRDRSRRVLGLSQKAYIEKMLKSYKMQKCSPSVALIFKGDKFSKSQCPKTESERKQMEDNEYASVVGSLMYAQVCTRPDIKFVVGMLGRYQSNPGLDHWRAAKKVLRYLQWTKDYMLTYRKFESLEVIGYSDSDFVGCVDTRKSTSGYIFMLTGGPISWKSAKQSLYALTGGVLPPLMPNLEPSHLKKRPSVGKEKITWQWLPFTSSARTDSLQLYHWVRVVNGVPPTGDYAFAKYNKSVDVLKYTDEEYEKHLTDNAWSKEETDQLFELCEKFDLRFIVIADRFPSDRTVEELKSRYYSVTRKLLIARAASPEDVANHPIVKEQFNAKHETERKCALSAVLSQTKQQECKDSEANVSPVTASIDAPPVIPDTSSIPANLRMQKVYLRSNALDQMLQAVSTASGSTNIHIEQMIKDLLVNLKPKVPTKAVCAEHLELRKEILTLLNLQKLMQKLTEATGSRERPHSEAPATPKRSNRDVDRPFGSDAGGFGGE